MPRACPLFDSGPCNTQPQATAGIWRFASLKGMLKGFPLSQSPFASAPLLPGVIFTLNKSKPLRRMIPINNWVYWCGTSSSHLGPHLASREAQTRLTMTRQVSRLARARRARPRGEPALTSRLGAHSRRAYCGRPAAARRVKADGPRRRAAHSLDALRAASEASTRAHSPLDAR